MMGLLDGEPSGKASSLCKRFLRVLILLFTSVCNMWVRIRATSGGIWNDSAAVVQNSLRKDNGLEEVLLARLDLVSTLSAGSTVLLLLILHVFPPKELAPSSIHHAHDESEGSAIASACWLIPRSVNAQKSTPLQKMLSQR